MKKIFSIIGALLAGAAMFSCATPEEPQPALGTTISVTPESLEVAGKDGQATTLEVTADGVWMAQADAWITVEPMTGVGNTTVTVKCADNMDPEAPEELDAPRKGEITFAVSKENVVVVEVAQAGDPEKAAKKLPFTETFENGMGRFKVEDVVLPEGSSYVWKADSYGGVAYMKASGYVGAAKDAESYLVSPVLDLTSESKAVVTFDHTGKFFGDMVKEAQLWVREEGADKWGKQLEITGWMTGSDYVFVNSGVISLEEYVGKRIQLGWRYLSSPDAAGTWEVNNIKVYNPDTTTDTPEPEEPETPEEPEEPEVVTATISEIAEAGKYKVEGATILASYARGYLLGDSTGKMLAYLGADHGLSLVAGDVVTIEGSVSEYGGFFQFVAGSTLTKTGTAEVNHGEVEVMDGAAMDAYVTAPAIKYVSYTGKLAVSGSYFNVNIEGAATAMGSLQYPIEAEAISALNGKNITVTGYAIGVSSGKYVNTMVISVEEVAGGEEPEPEPEITTSTFGAITEAGDYKVENAVVVNVTLKGYLLYDGTGYAYVYVGSKTDYVVGTKMTVIGTVSYYYDMMQIAPTAVEDVTTVEGTHPEAEVMDGAAIDAYMSNPTYKYVKVTGKLSVGSYTNLIVEGTTNTVSVSYFDGDLSAMNDKDVTLYGYLGGSNTTKGYVTMYLVSCEEVVAEPEEPENPEGGRLYWGNDEFNDIYVNALNSSSSEIKAENILTAMTPIEGKLTVDENGFTYNGLTYALCDGGKFKFGENQSLSDPAGDKEIRLQLGGAGKISTMKNILYFEAPAAGTLKIDAVSSSKDQVRPLAIAIDGTEIGQYDTVLQGAEATGEIFTVDCSAATAGSKIYIYSASGGMNIFSVEYIY